jgi:hypothetical protein
VRVAVLALLLCGCHVSSSDRSASDVRNDELIRENKKCLDAKMIPKMVEP